MKRQNAIFETGLAVYSVLISFICVFYAMGIFSAEHISEWNKLFAYVAAGYGLGNIYILSWAWRSSGSGSGPVWANKLIAICFFSALFLNMWKSGGGSYLQYMGALGAAAVLWLNWYAVKTISARVGAEVEVKPKKKGRR